MINLHSEQTRSYSQEDVREILNIALANHSTINAKLSHAQLLEIAPTLFKHRWYLVRQLCQISIDRQYTLKSPALT
jgi:hypothetical protein